MFIYKYVRHMMKNPEFHIMLSIMMTGGYLILIGLQLVWFRLVPGPSLAEKSAQKLSSLIQGEGLLILCLSGIYVTAWMFHFSLCVLVNMTKWFGVRTLIIAIGFGLLLSSGLLALTIWLAVFS
jgi:hypothetical protein